MIKKAAIGTKGGSGSSGMDADGWRTILAPNNFGTSSCDLRKAFANVAFRNVLEDKNTNIRKKKSKRKKSAYNHLTIYESVHLNM